MKLTDPMTIQESEKEFIDTINAELDWEAIEKMLFEKHGFTLQDEIEYKNGDLMVYKDEIAYRFDFQIKVPLSIIFNRQGECMDISTLGDDNDSEKGDGNDLSGQDNAGPLRNLEPNDHIDQMASNIADMISEINQPETEKKGE